MPEVPKARPRCECCGCCGHRNPDVRHGLLCRRYPPREPVDDASRMGVRVPVDGWCGEYMPREH